MEDLRNRIKDYAIAGGLALAMSVPLEGMAFENLDRANADKVIYAQVSEEGYPRRILFGYDSNNDGSIDRIKEVINYGIASVRGVPQGYFNCYSGDVCFEGLAKTLEEGEDRRS